MTLACRSHYPLGEPEYTVEDMADDAVAVLDAYDIDTAHIVGASMGGMITQQVALRHRDRVRTITPIMSTPDPGAVVGDDFGRRRVEALFPARSPSCWPRLSLRPASIRTTSRR